MISTVRILRGMTMMSEDQEVLLPSAFVPPKPLMLPEEYEYRQVAIQEKKLTLMDELLDVTSCALKRGKVIIDNVDSASQLRDFSAAVKNFSDVFSDKVQGSIKKDEPKEKAGAFGGVNINITFDSDKAKTKGKVDTLDIDYTEAEILADDDEVRF